MSTTASETATDWREGRCIRAWDFYEQCWSGKQIAVALGIAAGAVSKGRERARAGRLSARRRCTGDAQPSGMARSTRLPGGRAAMRPPDCHR